MDATFDKLCHAELELAVRLHHAAVVEMEKQRERFKRNSGVSRPVKNLLVEMAVAADAVSRAYQFGESLSKKTPDPTKRRLTELRGHLIVLNEAYEQLLRTLSSERNTMQWLLEVVHDIRTGIPVSKIPDKHLSLAVHQMEVALGTALPLLDAAMNYKRCDRGEWLQVYGTEGHGARNWRRSILRRIVPSLNEPSVLQLMGRIQAERGLGETSFFPVKGRTRPSLVGAVDKQSSAVMYQEEGASNKTPLHPDIHVSVGEGFFMVKILKRPVSFSEKFFSAHPDYLDMREGSEVCLKVYPLQFSRMYQNALQVLEEYQGRRHQAIKAWEVFSKEDAIRTTLERLKTTLSKEEFEVVMRIKNAVPAQEFALLAGCIK